MNIIEAILAVDSEFGLSKDGKIPWNNKIDMKFFRDKTINNIVVMGSKTLLSLPNKTPLKDRLNIILTKNKHHYLINYSKYDNIIFLNYEELIDFFSIKQDKIIYIIGGKEIYNLLLPFCNRIWITILNQNYQCDLSMTINLDKYNTRKIYHNQDINIYLLSEKTE